MMCLTHSNACSGELRHGTCSFALNTQVLIKINNVYVNLKSQMKLDLCIHEALSYTLGTMETAIVGVAINTSIMLMFENLSSKAEQKTTIARYPNLLY